MLPNELYNENPDVEIDMPSILRDSDNLSYTNEPSDMEKSPIAPSVAVIVPIIFAFSAYKCPALVT
jgi:hypothetical protein